MANDTIGAWCGSFRRQGVFLSGAVAFALCGLTAMPAPAQKRDDPVVVEGTKALRRVDSDVANLERSLSISRTAIANAVAQARFFPIERRLMDADLMFETKEYDTAATLYRDLVDNPAFLGNPGYYRAVFKLAESLFNMRNYVSAANYYKIVAVPQAGANYNTAVSRVFETAVLLQNFKGVEVYESLLASGMIGSHDVLYSYGKFLYHKGDKNKAMEFFARVATNTPSYAKSRYFMGAIETGAGRMETALSSFSLAAAVAPVTDADREVQGLAVLGKARVLHELERYQEALSVLQEVNPKTGAYVDSLFDTAWTFLKLNELEKATHALNMLLVAVPDGKLALKASALRGRILVRLGDVEGASETYKEVSVSLTPVTAELDQVARDQKNLAAYFDWVINRNTPDFTVDAPVSERTQRWIESDRDMATILGMVKDLSHEHDTVREAFEVAETLLTALRTGNNFDAFPDLKDKLLRLREIEARFLISACEAGDVGVRLIKRGTTDDAGVAYASAVKRRREIEAQFRSGPQTYADYASREKKASSDYQDVERELFLVESFLSIERQQMNAIEQWAEGHPAQPAPGQSESVSNAEIEASLDNHKRLLSDLERETVRLREELDKDKVMSLSQAEILAADQGNRRTLIFALIEETKRFKDVSTGLEGAWQEMAQAATFMVQRATSGAEAVDPLAKNLVDVVHKGAQDFETAVMREKERLQELTGSLQKIEMDSRVFAQTEGAAVFRGMKDRLRDVLFEADVGIVDMAWQREQAVAEQLKQLGLSRAEKMKQVEESQRLLEQTKAMGGSSEQPAAGTPK